MLPVVLVFTITTFANEALSTPREDCFPVERLDSELRALSEELMLRALDGEALYTFVGGVKPMSGFIEFRIPVGELDLKELEKTRRALLAWRCGTDLYADVRHFEKPHAKKLYAEGAVWHRPVLSTLVREHESFFSRFGVTESSHPLEIVLAIEYDEGLDRYRGYGMLYGYPSYAVDYFVQSEARRLADHERAERDFYSLPTFARPTGAYAWAVPKGHVENDADRALKRRAAAILAAYREKRAHYIGPGKPGVVELLRDWYDDGSGRLAIEHATPRAAQ